MKVLGVLILVALGAILLFLASVAVRAVLSVVGLGRFCCRLGWHLWWGIDLHVRQGLTTRTTTYLAVNGRRISRCLTCEKVHPPEGAQAYRLWKAGGIEVEGGPLSKPKITAKPPEELASDLFDQSLRRLAANPANEAALSEARDAGNEWITVTVAKFTQQAEALPTSEVAEFLDWTTRMSRGLAEDKIAAALQGKPPPRAT